MATDATSRRLQGSGGSRLRREVGDKGRPGLGGSRCRSRWAALALGGRRCRRGWGGLRGAAGGCGAQWAGLGRGAVGGAGAWLRGAVGRGVAPSLPRTVPEGAKPCARVPAALSVECSPRHGPTGSSALAPSHRGTPGELGLVAHKRQVWNARRKPRAPRRPPAGAPSSRQRRRRPRGRLSKAQDATIRVSQGSSVRPLPPKSVNHTEEPEGEPAGRPFSGRRLFSAAQ